MVLSLLSKAKALVSGDKDPSEISELVGISDCDVDCGDCVGKFPASMKIDTDSPLYQSTKPFKLHLIVATGKSDWPHDATGVLGTVEHSVASWASSNDGSYGPIKVSASSISNAEGGEIVVMPYFVKVQNITVDNAADLLGRLVPALQKADTDKVPEVPGVDIAPLGLRSLVLLCSHKTRDKRCGITAPILKKEFAMHLRDLGLLRDVGDDRPGGVEVAYINHVGGHKFTANVIVYLKSGEMIWMARVGPQNVKPIIDETILKAKTWPEKVRLVQKCQAIAW